MDYEIVAGGTLLHRSTLSPYQQLPNRRGLPGHEPSASAVDSGASAALWCGS